nr:lysophospholipase [Gammaproteobacteria bacterium]
MSAAVHQHRWSPNAGVTVKNTGVYLLHGTGEHAGRYTRLVEALTTMGFMVGSHDHPGHGLSQGKRGVINP